MKIMKSGSVDVDDERSEDVLVLVCGLRRDMIQCRRRRRRSAPSTVMYVREEVRI